MTEIARSSGEAGRDLIARASEVIEEAQAAAVRQANLALRLTFWRLARLVSEEVLGSERAAYGAQIVVSLGRQLSWTHFRALLPLNTPEVRAFYVQEAVSQGLRVRGLRQLIARKGYERREIANTQIVGETAAPRGVFRDPYLLDFRGREDTFLERDLETAIIRDMEAFLLEAGNGFAFVDRQKRMIIDDDYRLDLLFFSRPLRRLAAVELKIGTFKAAYEGQMKLYLKWLDCYERRVGEEPPTGLILCTGASREQIELLEIHKDGIVVAEYWTALLPKAELQARIQQIYEAAAERVAMRELGASPEREDAE